jgi:hypothetical protein
MQRKLAKYTGNSNPLSHKFIENLTFEQIKKISTKEQSNIALENV